MKFQLVLILFCSLLSTHCKDNLKKDSNKSGLKEIFEIEKEFQKRVAEKGLAESFYQFADDSAVIKRGEGLIKGKEAIRKHYSASSLKNVSLKWDVEFADISQSGDLAYTYGKYTFTSIDSSNKQNDGTGLFHTVWKKQSNGSWKFVWD